MESDWIYFFSVSVIFQYGTKRVRIGSNLIIHDIILDKITVAKKYLILL